MSKVSSRGQITIPVDIQRKMGMGPGTHIEMEIEDSRVILRKGRPEKEQDPVDRYYGYLHSERSTDELIEEMRGPVPEFVKRLAAERDRDHRRR